MASLFQLATLKSLKVTRKPELLVRSPLKMADGWPLRAPLALIWTGCPATGCTCCCPAGAACCCCCCPAGAAYCPAACCCNCPRMFPWMFAGCAIGGGWITTGGGGTGFWIMTAEVEAIGAMSTGISSPCVAACSITGRTGCVGDSCDCGPWRVAMWWIPPAKNYSSGL